MTARTDTTGFAIAGALTFKLSEVNIAAFPLNQSDATCPKTNLRDVFIFLVDDNPADVLLVREALTWHEVTTKIVVARDGDEAIRILDDIDTRLLTCPDLVVLDLNLPRKTGFEVLQRVRSSSRCRETPVAILSSSDAVSDRQKAAQFGATEYFQKPSNLNDFMLIGARLKRLIRNCE